MKTKRLSDAKRWMLVDDDKKALAVMRESVSRLGGMPVECFSSSQEALAAFEAAPDLFELVITDFQMPGMDGVELSRRMLVRSPKVKILLMTGSSQIAGDAVAHEGLFGLLKKPFSSDTLQRSLSVLTSGRIPIGVVTHPTA